jgi:general secretion pathway protein M
MTAIAPSPPHRKSSPAGRGPVPGYSVWLARWKQLPPRERLVLSCAAGLLAGLLLWLLALAPALQVGRTAPAQIARLEADQQRMTEWSESANAWRDKAQGRPTDLRASLAASTGSTLGEQASISSSAELAQVRVQAISASQLSDWLSLVRQQTRITPSEVELQADPDGLWSGSVTFPLGPEGRLP